MDEDLLAKALEGDHRAFAQVVKTYSGRLQRFAFRMTGDREAAADIVQEAFVRIWQSRSRYKAQGTEAAYLLQVVRRACVDYLRSNPRALEIALEAVPVGQIPVDVVETSCLGDALQLALGRLSEEQRAVYVLSEYEGMNYREIAATLCIPFGTVASRKHAASETLRRELRLWLKGDIDDV